MKASYICKLHRGFVVKNEYYILSIIFKFDKNLYI
jgi:hypothetical protein